MDVARILSDYAGAGLVGWWIGLPDDPHGWIIQIIPGQDTFVTKNYNAKQRSQAVILKMKQP